MAHTVYELDVRLRHIEPPIWRTVEIPGSTSLEDVHFAIQVAMGWTNSHLHEFRFGKARYGMMDVDGADDRALKDERDYRLEKVAREGSAFAYEYDFGDCWLHDVSVKRVTKISKRSRARCVAGARACPPEDCGGPHRYPEFLEALADPAHEEHLELTEWAGDIDPELFVLPKGGLDLEPAMQELKDILYGELDEASEMASILDEAMSLPPGDRAALIAVLSASLADELVSATNLLAQTQRDAKAKPGNRPRSRSRS